MQILTPDGYKDAADLKVGDQVVGADSQVNQVLEIDQTIYDLSDPEQNFNSYTINGSYSFFAEQSLVANGSAVHARELELGDMLVDDHGGEFTVTTISTHQATDWWRLIIDGDHTFVADGVLLHNASRYAVNITGTVSWNGTNTAIWAASTGGTSGSSVPGAGDDVFFDSASGSGTAQIVTNNPSNHSVDFTGGAGSPGNFAGTLTCSGARTWTIGGGATLTTAAVFKLSGSMTFSGGGTFTITFDNRNASGITVTMNGKAFGGTSTVNVTGANASDVTVFADNADLSLAAVNFNRGSFTVSSGTTFATLNSFTTTGGAGTNTMIYSGATIGVANFVNTSAGTLAVTGNSSSNLNISASGGSFQDNDQLTWPGTVTFNGGGSMSMSLTGLSHSFNNLKVLGTASVSDSFSLTSGSSFEITVTGTLTLTGNSPSKRLLVKGLTVGSQCFIHPTGSTSLTDVDFSDVHIVTVTISGTRLGDWQNNTGITFSSGNKYWVGGTGNWSDATNHWATSSGGAAGVNNYPLPQDTAVFDTNSFSANGQTATIDEPRLPAVNTTAATNHTFTITTGLACEEWGDWSLSAQCTFAIAAGLSFNANTRTTQTFTQNGATCTTASSGLMQVDGTGTLQQGDDHVWGGSAGGISLTNDTAGWNCNGHNLSTYSFTMTGGFTSTQTFTGASGKTLTFTGTGTVATIITALGNVVTTNSMNIAITDTSSTNKAINVSGTWGDLTITTGGTGTVTFSSTMSCNSMNVTGGGTKTIIFTASTGSTLLTPVFFRGTAGNLITIQSSVSGTQWSLNCDSRVVTDYISLQDSNGEGATTTLGGTPFYAGFHSTNVSGNTNWIFADPTNGDNLLTLGIG